MSIDSPNAARAADSDHTGVREMISCRGVGMRFPAPDRRGEFVALNDVNLAIGENEFVTLLGPSGCGKSTLLSLIAGFQAPTDGELRVDGAVVGGPSPDKGVVFQEYALFPWLRVNGNLRYGLRERGVPKEEQDRIVEEMVALTGLEAVVDHFPAQLSGGLKQRVALARALANDPKILLLDEPFGALDEQRRMQLQDELLRIWERARKTAVFVTHSIEEAIVLGDRVAVMSVNPGRIKDVIEVRLPRPRDRTSDEFNAIRRQVRESLF